MTPEQMRYYLKHNTKYGTAPKWQAKVDAMSDAQVLAVYTRMLNANELRKGKLTH